MASREEIPYSVIQIFKKPELQLDNLDKKRLSDAILLKTGEDASKPGLTQQKAKKVFEMALELGYTKPEFKNALDKFQLRQLFGGWSVSDILIEDNREKVINHEKYMKLLERGADARFYALIYCQGKPFYRKLNEIQVPKSNKYQPENWKPCTPEELAELRILIDEFKEKHGNWNQD